VCNLELSHFNKVFLKFHPTGYFLLVEEIRVPGGNHRPVASLWQTLSHVVSSTHFSGDRLWLHRYNVVVNPITLRSWPIFYYALTGYMATES
jgi:hypothetical protein